MKELEAGLEQPARKDPLPGDERFPGFLAEKDP
jgi:hypothetical protein